MTYKTFRFTPRNLGTLAVFLFGAGGLIYGFSVKENEMKDAQVGAKQ